MDTIRRDTLLADLSRTPEFLRRALARIRADELRRPPKSGGFSFVEQLWHLADLEREGYEQRIRRILAEDEPELPDFEGDRIARERRYLERDAHEGLEIFRLARERNVAALSRATSADFMRSGTQAEVGRITLADLPRMMSEHDQGHRAEIEALLSELAR
jgi:hypothetical protein